MSLQWHLLPKLSTASELCSSLFHPHAHTSLWLPSAPVCSPWTQELRKTTLHSLSSPSLNRRSSLTLVTPFGIDPDVVTSAFGSTSVAGISKDHIPTLVKLRHPYLVVITRKNGILEDKPRTWCQKGTVYFPLHDHPSGKALCTFGTETYWWGICDMGQKYPWAFSTR